MDYKLEYMERLFAKIGKKKTESYVKAGYGTSWMTTA